MVNNSTTNINKNHPSIQLIEWWSTIPPISTKITSHLNSLSDVQQFHQYQQKSPLTSTHWVMSTIPPISTKITSHLNSLSDVNNSTNINKNHLSPQLIEWWLTIPTISTKITSHLNSLSDGQQFHQYQQKSPLTSTHWVMVNNSNNIDKNHLSPQLIEWCQQFHQYQQKSPLTSTHWVMSTIPPISTKITSHLNSLNDG
jgi:predicted secreted protein